MIPTPSSISPSSIRAGITTSGRELLDAIWKFHRDAGFGHDAWPSTQSLHIQMGKDAVREIVSQLPPGSVYVTSNAPPRYALSFLGILLSTGGPDFQRVLTKFLDFVVAKAQENPHISEIDGTEATHAVNLSQGRRILLGRLVYLSGFWSTTFSGGESWKCGVPEDLDELIDLPNFTGYLWTKAIAAADRVAQATSRSIEVRKATGVSPLWFVRSRPLREALERDLQELHSLGEKAAPKSTVVLSGEILEGMLLDEISRRAKAARAGYQRIRKSAAPAFNRWTLGDLIDVSSGLGLLPPVPLQLGHALREFRNLIHPGKAARTRMRVSVEEARAARAALDVVRKHFSERASLRRKA